MPLSVYGVICYMASARLNLTPLWAGLIWEFKKVPAGAKRRVTHFGSAEMATTFK